MSNVTLAGLQSFLQPLQTNPSAAESASYYGYLSANGIAYGSLAEGVVTGSFTGLITQEFLIVAAYLNYSVTIGQSQLTPIFEDMAAADCSARISALNSGRSADLPYTSIAAYHTQVFVLDASVGIDCWTAYTPVSVLGQSAWSSLLVSGGIIGTASAASVYVQMFDVIAHPVYSRQAWQQSTRWCEEVDVAAILAAKQSTQSIPSWFKINASGSSSGGTIQLAAGDAGFASDSALTTFESSGGAYIYLGGGQNNTAKTQGDIVDLGLSVPNLNETVGDNLIEVSP